MIGHSWNFATGCVPVWQRNEGTDIMAWEDCKGCGWGLAEPGLGEAIIGKTECTNCEHPRVLTEDERLEIGQSFDQRIHMIEQAIWPLGK